MSLLTASAHAHTLLFSSLSFFLKHNGGNPPFSSTSLHLIELPSSNMANHHHHHHAHDTNLKSLLDTLYCSEEHWEEDVGEDELDEAENNNTTNNNATSSRSTLINSLHYPHVLFESDMFCDEQELTSLLGKEQHNPLTTCLQTNPALQCAHREAVEWMLRVNAHYSFSALTSLLAVNYFDRFLSTIHFQDAKPWMTHLAAVACLSLAAKVEETQVPLLLDLQVSFFLHSLTLPTQYKLFCSSLTFSCLHLLVIFSSYSYMSWLWLFSELCRWKRVDTCSKPKRLKGWRFWSFPPLDGRWTRQPLSPFLITSQEDLDWRIITAGTSSGSAKAFLFLSSEVISWFRRNIESASKLKDNFHV